MIEFHPRAAVGAPVVEGLLEKILGRGWYGGTFHGSIVHEGGGDQGMHQDQGEIPIDLHLDGADMMPALGGGEVDRSQPLFWCYYAALNRAKVAIRMGEWKLLASLLQALDAKLGHSLWCFFPPQSSSSNAELIGHILSLALEYVLLSLCSIHLTWIRSPSLPDVPNLPPLS